MKLQAPDKRRLTKYRDLCISSQNTALSDLSGSIDATGSALACSVATLSGTKLNALNTLGNRCSLHCSTPAVGGINQKYRDSTIAQIW